MKEYRVSITETLRMTVTVEAESMLEAEQKVSDAWRDSEYILDADNFTGVDFSAEDTVPKHEMKWSDMTALFSRVNRGDRAPVTGYIVFSLDSFKDSYNEEARTYTVSSRCKGFDPKAKGNSIFGDCLDGSERHIRLDGYIFSNEWKIEKCYMVESEYERLKNELSAEAVVEPVTVSR